MRMSHHNYTTSLVHILLCGTTGWALKTITFQAQPIAFGAFTFLLGHSLFGVLRYGHPIYANKLRRIDRFMSLAATILPLPLLNAQLYMQAQMDTFAYAHICSAFLPLLCNTLSSRSTDQALSLFMLGNITSLGFIGVLTDNYWAIGLTVLTAANHFVLPEVASSYQVPRTELFTIGMCFFTIFGVNCLIDSPGDYYLVKN